MQRALLQETPTSEHGAFFGQRWESASQALSRATSDMEGNETFVDVSGAPLLLPLCTSCEPRLLTEHDPCISAPA